MDVSIVIATYDRSAALAACLDSIAVAVARAPEVSAELLVVCNASPNDTPEVARAWAAKASFPVRVLMEPRAGACRARNLGIREAQGRLIVMTDDDCRLSETYLTDVTRAHAADTRPHLRGGRLELGDPEDLPMTIKVATEVQVFQDKVYPGGFLIGCNLAFPKVIVEQVGYFDERFGPGTPVAAAEDTDFLYRAWQAGIPVVYDPSFVIYHHHGRRTTEGVHKLVDTYLRADGAFYAKHMWRSPTVLRFLYWDMKGAVRELLGGELYSPELGLSHRMRVSSAVRGAASYLLARVKA